MENNNQLGLDKVPVDDTYSVTKVGSQTGIRNKNMENIYSAFNRMSSKGDDIKSSAATSIVSDADLQERLYVDLPSNQPYFWPSYSKKDTDMFSSESKIEYILHPDLKKRIKKMDDPSSNVKVKDVVVTKTE